ncbi:uncharacterized protein PV09_00658 [Verruconis gallopava]|uniref:Uncharacterized protein n=1 Tax=Verruconis gallopava TaxID=253628 RepID=A0A0D2BBJ2_9PEZI|nr:uncharacterized protein PV09_00658 [Verruconis gallopava]KIW08714.1 hypothetical protein PV09_00658 [Verruconis gallopava]
MRLEATIVSVFFAGHLGLALGSEIDAAAALHPRNADPDEHMRREANAVLHEFGKRGDVFNAPGGIWPTVVVPAGYTLAAGVMLTTASVTTTTATAAASAAAATSSGAALVEAAKSVNSTQWTAEAESSCMTAVMNLKGQASNPAGLAVCYNVPYLDQQKGVFEAELRMYNVCAPTGDFVGIPATDMMVTLSYAGATIQQLNGSQVPVKRSIVERQMFTTTSSVATTTSVAATNGIMMPVQVAVRQYVGQVNKDLLAQGMNTTEYQAVLVPQISISGMNPVSQKSVNTTLSSTEASFNAGVFVKAATNANDPQSILGKPAEEIAAAAAGLPTPFVVPGLALGVFPTGLIVTSIWTAIFLGVVGYGTFGRIQYRTQYRMAVKAQGEERQRRI